MSASQDEVIHELGMTWRGKPFLSHPVLACPYYATRCGHLPRSLARSPSLALLDLISLGWKVSSKWPSTAPFKAFVAPLTRLHFPDDAGLGTSEAAQVSLSSISHSPEPESRLRRMESELGGTGGLGVRVRSPLFQHPRVFNGEERRRLKSPCERTNERTTERTQ